VRGVQFFSDPYVKNLVFRDNTIKVISEDSKTTVGGCVVVHGLAERSPQHLPIFYNNNTFISNTCNVMFGDDYGIGSNHQFRNCRFVRVGNDSRYHTIQAGYWHWPTYNHLFIDSQVEGGASLENYYFKGTGRREYSIGHSLYVEAQSSYGRKLSNKTLTVTDDRGVSGIIQTDAQGRARLDLLERTISSGENQTQVQNTPRRGHAASIVGFDPCALPLNIVNTADNPFVLIFTGGPLPPPQDGVGIGTNVGKTPEISLNVSKDSSVKIRIFDRRGLVRSFFDGTLIAGDHILVWDGKNDKGDNVASGIYMAEIQIEGKVTKKKFAVLR